MRRKDKHRYDRSWKIAASLLGLVALFVAGFVVNLVELAAPWEFALYVAVIAVVLCGGTVWLVPGDRANRSKSVTVDESGM